MRVSGASHRLSGLRDASQGGRQATAIGRLACTFVPGRCKSGTRAQVGASALGRRAVGRVGVL